MLHAYSFSQRLRCAPQAWPTAAAADLTDRVSMAIYTAKAWRMQHTDEDNRIEEESADILLLQPSSNEMGRRRHELGGGLSAELGE